MSHDKLRRRCSTSAKQTHGGLPGGRLAGTAAAAAGAAAGAAAAVAAVAAVAGGGGSRGGLVGKSADLLWPVRANACTCWHAREEETCHTNTLYTQCRYSMWNLCNVDTAYTQCEKLGKKSRWSGMATN